MGNLVLSMIAIAVISASAIQIFVKNSETKNSKIQTAGALKYEKAIKTTGSSYANLDVKDNMVFITKNTRDKVILNKISKAVNDLIKTNPNATDFSCEKLASTGDVSKKECNAVRNKKYAVILPSNKAVENNTNSLVKKINNNDTINKVVVSEVSSALAPNAKAERTYVENIKTDKKTISTSADMAKAKRIVRVEKVINKAQQQQVAMVSIPMITTQTSSESREDRHEVGSVANVMKTQMSSFINNMQNRLSFIKSDNDTSKSKKTTKDTEKDNSLLGFFK